MIINLIGGGPSAEDLDTSRLKGLRIGINDAAFHKPCDVFFTNDHGYALRIRQQIEGFPGPRHLAVRQRFFERFRNWDATIWRRVDQIEPATRSVELSSGPAGTPGCSGYVAINLAAQLGAKTVLLFGYDFHPVYRCFFSPDPYPRISVPEVVESFRKVAPWYKRRGVRVLNANPDSAIDAFPKITHEEAFALEESCDRHDRKTGAGSLIAGLA